MLNDTVVHNVWRRRTARSQNTDAVLDSWLGISSDYRAAKLLVGGTVEQAIVVGKSKGWKALLDGDLKYAVEQADKLGRDHGAGIVMHAEALMSSGAFVAMIRNLDFFHQQGIPEATFCLATKLYLLGDYESCKNVAMHMPMHANTILIGARAAVVMKSYQDALEMITPFMTGAAPVEEGNLVGSFALVAANCLVGLGHREHLLEFSESLLDAIDLREEMSPMVARIAWLANNAQKAWDLYNDVDENIWSSIARMELALIAGNVKDAEILAAKNKNYGTLVTPLIRFLQGHVGPSSTDVSNIVRQDDNPFAQEGALIHIWRTTPNRCQPWINAALAQKANVEIYDLTNRDLPKVDVIPDKVVLDVNLIDYMEPISFDEVNLKGKGIWIEDSLCSKVALDCDWPETETDTFKESVEMASDSSSAAVIIASAEKAIEFAMQGRPTVAISIPGDQFWISPSPEKLWKAMRMVNPEPEQENVWEGAGENVLEYIQEFQKMPVN